MNLRLKYFLPVTLILASVAVSTPSPWAESIAQSSSDDLQNALRRIAKNPNDSSALADAGLAALKMGDTRAALGFLARADDIYPNSGRVKAGLGRALLAEENPLGAIRYFDQAVSHGVPLKEIAADRGLAYDLVGRNLDAQKDYEVALGHDPGDAVVSRYAISLGISGDIERADAQLNPMLQKSSRDAWRYRAFILAMNGKGKDANSIAKQTMPRKLARAIKPFFERMPKLTAAQKAAAVHFGHFPASENIGIDVAAVRLAANMARLGVNGADAGLIPIGQPLGNQALTPRVMAMPDKSPRRRPGSGGSKDRNSKNKAADVEVAVLSRTILPLPKATPVRVYAAAAAEAAGAGTGQSPEATTKVAPVPTPESNRQAGNALNPGFTTSLGLGGTAPLVSESIERKVVIAGHQPPKVEPTVALARSVDTGKVVGAKPAENLLLSTAQPVTIPPSQITSFDLAKTPKFAGPAGEVVVEKPVQTTSANRSLADIIGGITVPDEERATKVVPVNLDTIQPAKPKPKVVKKVEAKPKEPEHPKRYWVQIATGANRDALKYDYRRISKKQVNLFKGQKAWTSRWGKTRRLVVGPFDDFKAAKAFEVDFRKGGGDGFAWASANGVEVNELTK